MPMSDGERNASVLAGMFFAVAFLVIVAYLASKHPDRWVRCEDYAHHACEWAPRSERAICEVEHLETCETWISRRLRMGR